jgi:hypothetical protein
MRLTASTRARAAIVFAAISLFSACDDPIANDRAAPRLINTAPRTGQVDILTTSTISAVFSENISAESVGPQGLTVTGPGGAAVAGSLTVSGGTITFTPTAPLQYNTQYTGTVAPGVEDLLGNRLNTGHTWTFTTIVNAPPTVTARVPGAAATGASRTNPITVTFSEPIAPASVTNTTFTVTPASGTPIAGTITVAGAVVTFTPTTALAPNVVYTIRATTGITDVDGAPLAAEFTSTFTTTANTAPTANAGAAQDVARLTNVTLAGTATDPGGLAITSYRWTQTSGPDVTGGAGFLTGQNPSFLAPANVSSVRFELRTTNSAGTQSTASPVTIFVLEDPAAGRSIYVAANGNDVNTGVRASPMRTITAAMNRAITAGGGTDIYVAAGTFDGTVTLASGTSIYGGYTQTTWLRDTDANASIVQGGASGIAIQGTGVANLSLDGLRINTPATTTTAGLSMYGVLLTNSQNVRITNNRITAGAGGAGAAGAAGVAGIAGLGGGNGAAAVCTAAPATGGAGGAGGQPGAAAGGAQVGVAGGAGGAGGNENAVGASGAAGAGAAPGSAGPGGGVGANGSDGGAGGQGADGTNGTGGAGFGSVGATGYVVTTATAGTAGTAGATGSSGGGAGGGGGAATGAGGGGGGGGASGGGGTLGQGGGGGGGSFAIALINSVTIFIDRNTLTTGAGGAGGAGGTGGTGGAGGAGGTGGAGCNSGGNGGTGGAGGMGGRGGHGGGGGGGPSIGILEDAASSSSQTNNTFTIGAAGAGGASSGAAGASGVAANTRKGA